MWRQPWSKTRNFGLDVRAFDADYAVEVENLLAAEFLVSSDDDLSVSFRHQTMFDFLRARAFLRSEEGLANYILVVKQESLFVRPILWSAFAYLRQSDQSVYRREFRPALERQEPAIAPAVSVDITPRSATRSRQHRGEMAVASAL